MSDYEKKNTGTNADTVSSAEEQADERNPQTHVSEEQADTKDIQDPVSGAQTVGKNEHRFSCNEPGGYHRRAYRKGQCFAEYRG